MKENTFDMWITCVHASNMKKMIQVRNVPEKIHRILKVRAAQAGTTLSEYLLAELTQIAERPTLEDVLARMEAGPAHPDVDVVAAVRSERESRE